MQILYTFWHPKRKQRTKVNAPYSNFDEVFSGVTQGSTFLLGPLLFNIYIHDLFFRIGDLQMTSFAEDNTPFTFTSKLDVALKKLMSYTIKISEWFHNNRLKSNSGKCNLITRFTSPVAFQIENTVISSANKCQTFRCSY